MSLPPLSEELIAQNASPRSLERGWDYYQGGAVLSVVQRGELLQAWVEGSEPEPYQVIILFDREELVEARCSCPYDWGGWCKHIVAVLLACIHEPEAVEERPPLKELLEGLDRGQLETLLLRLASFSVEWTEAIEEEVERLREGHGRSR